MSSQATSDEKAINFAPMIFPDFPFPTTSRPRKGESDRFGWRESLNCKCKYADKIEIFKFSLLKINITFNCLRSFEFEISKFQIHVFWRILIAYSRFLKVQNDLSAFSGSHLFDPFQDLSISQMFRLPNILIETTWNFLNNLK